MAVQKKVMTVSDVREMLRRTQGRVAVVDPTVSPDVPVSDVKPTKANEPVPETKKAAEEARKAVSKKSESSS